MANKPKPLRCCAGCGRDVRCHWKYALCHRCRVGAGSKIWKRYAVQIPEEFEGSERTQFEHDLVEAGENWDEYMKDPWNVHRAAFQERSPKKLKRLGFFS